MTARKSSQHMLLLQVAVNTCITNINEFLDHIVASTNMRCLTPPIALDGDCGFLAANLYAKSAFGEDALVNVSIEKTRNGKLAGNIRIRCLLPRRLSCIADVCMVVDVGGRCPIAVIRMR